MAEQFGDKSIEPTPYRREQARREGHVAKSQDLASAVLLLVALVTLLYFGRGLVDFFGRLAHDQLGEAAVAPVEQGEVVAVWHAVVWGLARTLLPLLLLVAVAGVVINVVQVGFLFLPQKLAWDVRRINPAEGLQRLASLSNVVRLGFGIFKILVVVGVACWSLWADRGRIVAASALAVPQIAALLADVALWTCLKIGLALLVLALLDYAYQRWKHERDLWMTPQELREELKHLQGDPQILARRRAIQRQLVLNRLTTIVPRADVVVTNPTELAIALQYDPATMPAPVVVAKGAGLLAMRIRQLALEHGIPVVERKELAQVLYKQVDVNQAIPSDQYAAVAEVLRYVYELKGQMPEALRQAA